MKKIPNRTRTTARINIGVMARFETYRRNAFQPIVPAQSWLMEKIIDEWLKEKGL